MDKIYAYRPQGERAATLLFRRPVLLIGLAVTLILLFFWSRPQDVRRVLIPEPRPQFSGSWDPSHRNNLMFTDDQCDEAFPKLFEEIERATLSRAHHRITKDELDRIEPKNGFIRAMIYDQQLYIIAKQGNIYSRELASLHAVQRAIYTSPSTLPNIEFAFNTDDVIFEKVPLWGYARKPEHDHIWLMPDFGYWSWPETQVGCMREVQMKAVERDQVEPWKGKVSKLLWRGAMMGLPLREKLVEVTKDKSWADVVALDWRNKESMKNDLKSMPEHCGNKFLAHTEGNSYSGRLKYLQACESVIVAHKMDWIQHQHPLMVASGPEQNYVEVRRDFGDLEEVVMALQKDDALAHRIARNNVETFRNRYLTPAAEACYWRRLFRSWATVSFEPEFYEVVNGTKRWRGLPFESFALERRLDWEPY